MPSVRCGLRDDEIAAHEHLAFAGEDDLDRIVHPPAEDDFQPAAVGAAAIDRGRLAAPGRAVRELHVVAVATVAEVEPSIGPEERAVQVRAVSDRAEAGDDLRAACRTRRRR